MSTGSFTIFTFVTWGWAGLVGRMAQIGPAEPRRPAVGKAGTQELLHSCFGNPPGVAVACNRRHATIQRISSTVAPTNTAFASSAQITPTSRSSLEPSPATLGASRLGRPGGNAGYDPLALLQLPRRPLDVGWRFAPLRIPQPPSVGNYKAGLICSGSAATFSGRDRPTLKPVQCRLGGRTLGPRQQPGHAAQRHALVARVDRPYVWHLLSVICHVL